MRRVLFDVNVVLDVLLGREPWYDDAAAIFRANQGGQLDAFLCAASLPTIFYLARRQAGLERAHRIVSESLSSFSLVPVGRIVLEMAAVGPGSDFEDNLQIACAVRLGLDAIITRDATGFAESPVRILSPGEVRSALEQAGAPEAGS